MKKSILLMAFMMFCAAWIPAYAGTTSDKLTLALDWFVNPDHASIIIAQEKGFFKEQNLEIKLVSPADWTDPPKLVAANQADLAITYEPEFIDQIEQGLPLITIGALIDHPLNCLLVLNNSSIKSIKDLKNKRIGNSSGGILAIMLKTMLQRNGLSSKDVEFINVRHNGIQALLSGRVDALSGAMRNIEPQIDLGDYKPLIFLPEENGVPRYSELIFVTRKDKLQNPQQRLVLEHFLLALEKASTYLKQHPEECWQIFAKKYPALNNSLNHRAWNATLPYLSDHPQHLSAQEWRAFIEFLRQNELIKSKYALSEYITEMHS